MAEDQLRYHVALKKLELLQEEIGDIVRSKISAIWPQHDDEKKVLEAIEELKSLTPKTKRDGTFDQRCKKSITYHQELGTISGPGSSPKKEACRDENYVQNMKNAYHQDQQYLFSLLIDHCAMDKKLDVSEGNLKRNGIELTHVQMCNTVDEATSYMLAKEMPRNSGSMTSGITEREHIRKMYDLCVKVVSTRIAVSDTFDDNILDEKSYKTWRKHVRIVASFGALAVALKRLL